jgi:hypothetical protein
MRDLIIENVLEAEGLLEKSKDEHSTYNAWSVKRMQRMKELNELSDKDLLIELLNLYI